MALAAAVLLAVFVGPATADANGDSITASASLVYAGSVVTLLDDAPAVIDTAPGQLEYDVFGGPGVITGLEIDFVANDRFVVRMTQTDFSNAPNSLQVQIDGLNFVGQPGRTLAGVTRISGTAGFLVDVQFGPRSIYLVSDPSVSPFSAINYQAEFEYEFTTTTPISARAIRDHRSANSIGIAAGDRIMIEETQGFLNPGSTCTASQGSVALRMLRRELQTAPALYSRSIEYDFALAGDWTVECLFPGSGSNERIVPGVADAELMPLVENVHTVGRLDTTPKFAWDFPDSGVFHSKVQIGIWDRDDFTSGGQANKILDVLLSPSSTSYEVPISLGLEKGHRYTLSIELVAYRGDGSPLTRSRYFHDFTPVTDTLLTGEPFMDDSNYEGTLADVVFVDPVTARLEEGDSFTVLASRPGVIVPADKTFLEVDYEWINDGDFDDAGILLDVSGGGMPSESLLLFATHAQNDGGTFTPAPSESGRFSIDLSPYVGRDVSIRFQIARASAQTGPGSTFTLSNLELTQDGHDPDDDGLPSSWEQHGYYAGGEYVDLPALGANPFRKDAFVYVDYMQNAQFDHRPADLSNICLAFAQAPVLNPDGSQGIDLHVAVSPDPTDYRDVAGPTDLFATELGALDTAGKYKWSRGGDTGSTIYFDDIKLGYAGLGIRAHFPPELAKAFRYCLFAHIIGGFTTKYTGYSRGNAPGDPSSDFLITLGERLVADGLSTPPPQWQQGTFMHELGHTLGLQHGGDQTTERKPNYLSVMNYSFQLEGLDRNGTRVFDYSAIHLPSLDENALDEMVGLGYWREAATGYKTLWYQGLSADSGQWTSPLFTEALNFAVDWNRQNGDQETGVAVSINLDTPKQVLTGHHDWARLKFRGGTIGAGAPLPGDLPAATLSTEITLEEAAQIPSAPVAGLAARAGRGSVRLAWNPRGPGGTVTYRVYRKVAGAAGDPAQVGTTTATLFLDRGLASGTTYEYAVRWINGFGVESSATDPVTVMVR